MGDEDRRDLRLLLNAADFLTHLDAQARVQVGERLVEQQHLRLLDQRAGDRDALLLSAGELARLAPEVFLDLNELGRALHLLADLLAGIALPRRGIPDVRQREGDIVRHGHVRIQRVILEDEPDVALLRHGGRHILLAEPDFALGDVLKARKHVERGRFAAATRPEQARQLAILKRQVEAVDGHGIVKAFGQILQDNLHSLLPPSSEAESRAAVPPGGGQSGRRIRWLFTLISLLYWVFAHVSRILSLIIRVICKIWPRPAFRLLFCLSDREKGRPALPCGEGKSVL